jgi:hypothetical protein
MFLELIGKKFIISVTEILFLSSKVFFFGVYEGDPLSPQEGRQHAGSTPLTPFSTYFHQPSDGLSHFGGMPEQRGQKARCAGAPKSDY